MTDPAPTRAILKADGTIIPLTGRTTVEDVASVIPQAIACTVNLRDGRVLLSDDQAIAKGLPINAAATALYHSVCRPGTFHDIRGDAMVTLDADFEPDYGP